MLAKKKQNNISATVADDHLVLSLPNATEPVIWRKSLDQIGSATFEVKKSSKENLYNLTLKKTKTTSETIASFENKEDAVAALNAASTAFHSGPAAPLKSSANQNEPDEKSGKKKWLYALLALGVVIGLYMYMISLIPDQTVFTNDSATSNAPVSRGPITPESTGVPVSADDFLNSR